MIFVFVIYPFILAGQFRMFQVKVLLDRRLPIFTNSRHLLYHYHLFYGLVISTTEPQEIDARTNDLPGQIFAVPISKVISCL